MRQTIITQNFKDTQKIGLQFVNDLKNGGVIALYGDLGSGKTTFVQGLAKGLGIKNKIISPTFIIVRRYNIPNYTSSGAERSREVLESNSRHLPAMQSKTLQAGTRTINFYHIDLYRVESENDIDGLGLSEILNDKSNIAVIEWPEKIEKILPKKRISMYFEYVDDYRRKIEVKT